MVGRVGLFHAVVRFAAMFKFAPGELVEPTTKGLKVQNGKL
jgi:hypothetical protein